MAFNKFEPPKNISCWHCNPNRTITPHPDPPSSMCDNFLDYRPTVSKPYDKKPAKRALKGAVLKSFDRPINYTNKNTKVKTLNDDLYSRQRTFMQVFQVDILNQQEFIDHYRTMTSFMSELDYIPTDKQDIMLFYHQESSQDLYDVYMARRSPLIKKYAQVFDVNLEFFDDALKFMQQLRTYVIEKTESQTPITMKNLNTFLKQNNPEQVYIDIEMVNMVKSLKIKP